MLSAEKCALKRILSYITGDDINWYYCLKTEIANIYQGPQKCLYFFIQ